LIFVKKSQKIKILTSKPRIDFCQKSSENEDFEKGTVPLIVFCQKSLKIKVLKRVTFIDFCQKSLKKEIPIHYFTEWCSDITKV